MKKSLSQSHFSSSAASPSKRRVHFSEACQVKFIQHTKTKQEKRDTHYTKEDLRRFRRMAESLADDLSFYSCDELWDRFGVRSKTQQYIRRQIRYATKQAVQSFNQDCQKGDGDDDLPGLVNDSEHSEDDDTSCNEDDDHYPLEEYFKITDACAIVAKERGRRIQEQVFRSHGLARKF